MSPIVGSSCSTVHYHSLADESQGCNYYMWCRSWVPPPHVVVRMTWLSQPSVGLRTGRRAHRTSCGGHCYALSVHADFRAHRRQTPPAPGVRSRWRRGRCGGLWRCPDVRSSAGATAKSAAKECVLLSSGATGGAWFDRAQGERVRKEANVALPKVQTVRADGRAGASNQAADENLSTST